MQSVSSRNWTRIAVSIFCNDNNYTTVCERWVETRTYCNIDPSSPFGHSSISFSSWLGLLNRGSLRAAKLVLTLASCLRLTQTVRAPRYIIFWHPLASAVLSLNYIGASLDWRLGRGSIYNNTALRMKWNSTLVLRLNWQTLTKP